MKLLLLFGCLLLTYVGIAKVWDSLKQKEIVLVLAYLLQTTIFGWISWLIMS